MKFSNLDNTHQPGGGDSVNRLFQSVVTQEMLKIFN